MCMSVFNFKDDAKLIKIQFCYYQYLVSFQDSILSQEHGQTQSWFAVIILNKIFELNHIYSLFISILSMLLNFSLF